MNFSVLSDVTRVWMRSIHNYLRCCSVTSSTPCTVQACFSSHPMCNVSKTCWDNGYSLHASVHECPTGDKRRRYLKTCGCPILATVLRTAFSLPNLILYTIWGIISWMVSPTTTSFPHHLILHPMRNTLLPRSRV